uniref:SON DNA and RNA binding protein n=1 Tax=Corvus moneduloides TaxID=1196302 RepID=A0A8U7MAB4_CORMO
MATNIEQILRSFVVSKFREIQEEQQHAKVEGQPNGDTIPAEQAEQAGPSEASGAAGSCQSDQIVQKIEEVLSGALGTELQCNPDKAQLLEIAKANAAAMCAKSGVPLPPSLMPLLSQKKDDKANQKSSRDTLKELTEKCKKIAQSTDDVIVNKPHVSDEEEEERPFYNHPFKLSEPKPIFFNLSVTPPPQPKNQVSLSKEFPVSSGSQHRKKEADSVYGEWVPVDKNGKDDGKDDVFPKPAIECVDITTAMNDRAVAQKRLNENSFDLEAMCMLNRAQEQVRGAFSSILGDSKKISVFLSWQLLWVRDQFLRAAPVTGGMGAQLMRKMGWREGEGLGKNKEGSVEPIMVDFKTDRKGLVAVGEKAQKRSGHYVVMKDLSGKHPVSALMEICNKRRWTPPEFVLVDDSGPDHRKHFIFKVGLGCPVLLPVCQG